MINGLNAVILIVKDIKQQKRFYKDVLKLKIIEDYGNAIFFSLGKQTLGLFSKEHHPEGAKRLEGATKGLSHLEFTINKKDEAKIRKRLEAAGYHAYNDNYQDADGNLFHFVIKK
ncbi:MAG: VOC family protein [Nanoarchaeota archaeon]|nr:VOC family protein [Nanoarchaeota archaeon]